MFPFGNAGFWVFRRYAWVGGHENEDDMEVRVNAAWCD